MQEQIKQRTKKISIDVWKLIEELPNTYSFQAYGKQLIRCSSSVGANYRAACRAKSTADFINKLKIVEEEADETIYFLELLLEVSPENIQSKIPSIKKETEEILKIVVSSIKTLRNKK